MKVRHRGSVGLLLSFVFFAAGFSGCGGSSSAVSASSGAPAAPVSLTATALSSGEVTLSWSAGDSNATGYYVGRSTDGGNTFSEVANLTSSGTDYTDSTVSGGVTYEYQVIAYNSSGNSQPSSPATVTTGTSSTLSSGSNTSSTGAPSAPVLSANVVSGSEIDVTWTAPTNASVTGYYIQRSTDGSNYLQAQTTQLGIADTTVSPGTTYYYRVIAYNSAGQSSPSNVAQVTSGAASTPPECQIRLSATSVSVGQSLTVTLLTTTNTTSATLQGVAVPATGGTWTITPSRAGYYPIQASVQGAGGSGSCNASFSAQ